MGWGNGPPPARTARGRVVPSSFRRALCSQQTMIKCIGRGATAIEKLLLYLETTVFNYYFDADREGHEDVVRLLEAIKAGEYEGYASWYVTDELQEAPEPKRSAMLSLIDEYGITVLDSIPEVARLADIYIEANVMSELHRLDSLHVATAAVYQLDCVISYNFQHINREKTKILTTAINHTEGYNEVTICTAREVLDDDRENA